MELNGPLCIIYSYFFYQVVVFLQFIRSYDVPSLVTPLCLFQYIFSPLITEWNNHGDEESLLSIPKFEYHITAYQENMLRIPITGAKWERTAFCFSSCEWRCYCKYLSIKLSLSASEMRADPPYSQRSTSQYWQSVWWHRHFCGFPGDKELRLFIVGAYWLSQSVSGSV